MRLARHAEAKGWTFPRFARDEVIQFAVEEALRVLVLEHDARAREKQLRDEAEAAAFQRADSAREAARQRQLGRG